MSGDLAELEEAVLAHAPQGAVVVGASISPDGTHAVALTILPTASNYPMDDRFELVESRWEEAGGGSGCGILWSSLDEGGDLGVLRYGDEAPDDAMAAWVAYEGREHRVPVRHGHFLFVSWRTSYSEEPRLLRFE
jgi:hypothetical protein